MLALLLLALNAFANANPQQARAGARSRRAASARLAARPSSLCAARSASRYRSASPGLGLLGWLPFGPAGFFQRTQKSPGQVSRVRSAFVEMELDHDTGAMRGRILAGQYEGRDLDTLDVPTLTGLLAEIDEESRALLMAYLDRRAAQLGVTTLQGDAAAGQSRSVVEQRQNDGTRRLIRSLACSRGRAPRTSDVPIARS